MLVIGAKGFAKEILEICKQNEVMKDLVFYDDINNDIGDFLYDKFMIIHSLENAKNYIIDIDAKFTLGIGNPTLRIQLFEKFSRLGGIFTSTISNNVEIGSFGVDIGAGCNILSGVKISNDVKIGKGAIIYYNSIITHDVLIGDFVEISPGVILLGRCVIGKHVKLGAGCIIFPDVKIGDRVIIGAGSVVRNDIPNNCVVVGIPGKIIKEY